MLKNILLKNESDIFWRLKVALNDYYELKESEHWYVFLYSHFTPLCRKVAVSCEDGQCSLKRITGHCFTFPLITFLWRQNTISDVRSKNPRSFFQLIPHLQCCKPINCCFIFLPQRGHILLVVPIRIPPGKPVLVFAFCLCGEYSTDSEPLNPLQRATRSE